LRSTLDQITNVEHRLAVLHTLGKIWAYKDEKQQFEEVKLQIVKLLDDGRIENDDLLCWTYASLARAQGYLQLPEAYRSLEEAKKVATRMKTEGQRSLLRMAQIVREEFEVIKQLDPTGHYHYLERQGQEALSMAQVCQCQRLALRLQDLLAQTFS
jgi:hypothetical protein